MGIGESFLAFLRDLATREESVTASRVVVFFVALTASFLWTRSRRQSALVVLTLGGMLGLSYWLVQLKAPFGLSTDVSLTEQWAQAGVSSVVADRAAGFVWGTPAAASLPALLSGFGVPMNLLHALPQLSVLLGLAFLAFLPQWGFRNRGTADFAGCLLIGGGLWPGSRIFDWLLENPTNGLKLGGASVLLILVGRLTRPSAFRRRFRFQMAAGVIVTGALTQSPMALLLATALLASPIRLAIRAMCPTASRARLVEALMILSVFGGSGLLWWNPPRTVPGFLAATDQGTALARPLEWVRLHVPPEEVVLASREYSATIAALAGRRVLFPPQDVPLSEASPPEPSRRARLWDSTLKGQPVARLAEHFSATHLFLGPGEPTPPLMVTDTDEEPTLSLVLVYQDIKDFRVFRLTKK